MEARERLRKDTRTASANRSSGRSVPPLWISRSRWR